MIRNALLGALVFGVTAAIAGYVWVALEFPFAIVLPAFVGWLAVSWRAYPGRTAVTAAVVGGIAFTALFVLGLFLAITDGSPVPIAGWAAAVVAAAVAGALAGWVLARSRGAVRMAGFSAAGMLAAVFVMAALRQFVPAGAETPGVGQSAYAALMLGSVGAIVGAAVGAGVGWLAASPSERDASSARQVGM